MSRSIITDRKKSAAYKHWTSRDKVRAVAAFLVLGSMTRVSEETGIPLPTLNSWKAQPWWFEQVAKIRQEQDTEVDNNFTKIVAKTQEIILDRLENGETIVTKGGTLLTKPVGARDAAIISAIAIDKRKVLRDVPASEQNKIGMQERLSKLEMQFTNLVTAKTIDGEFEEVKEPPIDVEPIEQEVPNGEFQGNSSEAPHTTGGADGP